MIELPFVFFAGLLGSAHCLGMCGGFALAIGGNQRTWQANLARQVTYTFGRLFTYLVLGALAGFCGWKLANWANVLLPVPALLAIVAGVVLLFQGLAAVGILKHSGVVGKATCLAGSFFANYLRGTQYSRIFLAGLFTGLLPCGLLYGMLALAASTHDLLPAMLLMLVFGLGTAPAMIFAGLGGPWISWRSRRWVYQFAAWCLVLTGLVSITRGSSFLLHSFRGDATSAAKACPFCSENRE